MNTRRNVILFMLIFLFGFAKLNYLKAQDFNKDQEIYFRALKKTIFDETIRSKLIRYSPPNDTLNELGFHVFVLKDSTVFEAFSNFKIEQDKSVFYFWDSETLFYFGIGYFIIVDMFKRSGNKIDIELRILNAYNHDLENMPSLKAQYRFLLKGHDLKIIKRKVKTLNR